MKYMTFNSSCAFAGIGNMLEFYGIYKEDYELAVEMKLPYLFQYDEKIKTYQTGIALQTADAFNLHLNTLGINIEEVLCSKDEICQKLEILDKPAMIGINNERGGKHAVIFLRRQDGHLFF